MYTREQIERAVKAKGYFWFEDRLNKGYDVNIVGVRNNAPIVADKVTNVFDDHITISYKVNGKWQFFCWRATVDPGKKGVQQFSNPKGVARLVSGQYRGAYAIDKHGGKYTALCQRLKPVTVYRDKDKDLTFDESKLDTGMFGINIHKAGRNSTWVENWSEGCQVFKVTLDFVAFMSIIQQARKIWGNKFTYTLIESTDIS